MHGGGSRIEPGERKAWRKRVVLSNGNALAVEGLRDLEKDTLLLDRRANGEEAEAEAAVVGTVRGLPDVVVDQLRAIEAFKSSQNWGLFRRPATLVRRETVELVAEMDRVVAAEKGVYRVVIDGERIAGKSTLLLQAMAHGFLNGWTVVHIPEGKPAPHSRSAAGPLTFL